MILCNPYIRPVHPHGDIQAVQANETIQWLGGPDTQHLKKRFRKKLPERYLAYLFFKIILAAA